MLEEKELLPIGVIAKSFGISESTIRRMEAANLLTPAKVTETKYRYYDSGNIARIVEILNLKSFGVRYADMRDHFDHPGDFTLLYQNLMDKQEALRRQIEKLRHRLRAKEGSLFEFEEYSSTYTYTLQTNSILDIKVFAEVATELQLEAIKCKLPINVLRPILILTECGDYREFDKDRIQPLTYCLPLTKAVNGKRIRNVPGRKALSVHLSPPMNNFPALIKQVTEIFEGQGLRQSAPLCVAYDVGSYLGQDIPLSATVLHAFVPYEAVEPKDSE